MIEIKKGTIFGNLEYISEGERKRHPSGQIKRFLKCKCSCGKIKDFSLQKLLLGETKSCGCVKRDAPNRKELGEYVGVFKYLGEAGFKNKKRYIKIKCFCGLEKETTLYVAEHSKSCGCLELLKIKRNKKTRDRVRINSSNRRAKMRTSSDGTINLNSINKIIEEQSGLCKNCGIDIKNNYHIDHIYPISKGGLHSIDNIQILCPSCNMKKSNKIITKY